MNFREFPPSREEIISLLVIIIKSFFVNITFLWKVHIQIYNLLSMLSVFSANVSVFFLLRYGKKAERDFKLARIRITCPSRQVS